MTYDAVVIGGGVAGLQAALTLGRACRSVRVVDAGAPRNASAPHSHNLLTRDGTPPLELLAAGRADLVPYGVAWTQGRVRTARSTEGDFALTLDDGSTVRARALVLATGQTDVLPDLPGLSDVWGTDVFFCPFCHGWERRGGVLGVWGQDAYAHHMASLLRLWTRDIVVFAGGPVVGEPFPEHVEVVHTPVERLLTEGTSLVGVLLADGTHRPLHGLLLRPPTSATHPLCVDLGVELGAEGMPVVGPGQSTSVPGVFVAGDLAHPMPALVNALSTGAIAGAGVCAFLVGRLSDGRSLVQPGTGG